MVFSARLIPAVPTVGVGKLHEESKARDRTLSDAEIRWFWRACDKLGFPFGHLFKTLLLTGCRRSEVAAMTPNELTWQSRLWELSGERMKTGNPHKIYLTPTLEKVLNSTPTGFDFVFGRKKPPSGFSKAKRALDAEMARLAHEDFETPPLPFVIHDLRRTFRTGLARLGVATEVAERCVAHSSGPSFEGVSRHLQSVWLSRRNASGVRSVGRVCRQDRDTKAVQSGDVSLSQSSTRLDWP